MLDVVDQVIKLAPEAEAAPVTRAGISRRRKAGRVLRARLPRRAGEVYIEPDGMVDVALRELGARLVVDDPDSPEPGPGN
jgi:hypothetical protein